MVKIGWKAGAEQFTPGSLMCAAELAKQKGFEFIDIGESA